MFGEEKVRRTVGIDKGGDIHYAMSYVNVKFYYANYRPAKGSRVNRSRVYIIGPYRRNV